MTASKGDFGYLFYCLNHHLKMFQKTDLDQVNLNIHRLYGYRGLSIQAHEVLALHSMLEPKGISLQTEPAFPLLIEIQSRVIANDSRIQLSMTTELKFYLATWISYCFLCIWLYLSDRASFPLKAYKSFLYVPWKLVTFGIAAIGITAVAPYTADPTWDYFDAAMMSALTFLTAPWATGIIYLGIRGKARIRHVLVAIGVWMFSASWCYDLYLLIRDGYYPITWEVNIYASSVLYFSAGLLWNLEYRAGRGVTFSFLEPGFPVRPQQTGFARIALFGLPFMLLAICCIGYFLI